MSNKQRTTQTQFAPLSGKIHLTGEEVFPPYDFFQQESPREQQRERLHKAIESCRDGWRRRLEAMLCRSELSLSCRLLTQAEDDAETLYFVMEHQWDGRLQRSAALYIEHATLYQLAEMTFGGMPTDRAMTLRGVSETERRLGNSLLSMLTDNLVARILPEAVPASPRMLGFKPDIAAVSYLKFEIHFAGRQLSWVLALPALEVAPQAQNEPVITGLAVELNAGLPGLNTRLSVPLASFELPLGRLAELREGDVLPIHLLQEVVARAGDLPVLKGRVAERDGMLVFASHGFID